MVELNQPTDIGRDLWPIASSVYTEYAAAGEVNGVKLNQPLHYAELCAELSMLTRERLRSHGIPADLKLFVSPSNAHYFLYIPQEGIDVDLTWQQFLPPTKRAPDLPQALIWPHATITQRLGQLGMSRRRLPIWTQAETSNHRWQSLGSPVLETILGVG